MFGSNVWCIHLNVCMGGAKVFLLGGRMGAEGRAWEHTLGRHYWHLSLWQDTWRQGKGMEGS